MNKMGGGLMLSSKRKKQLKKLKGKVKQEEVGNKYSFLEDEINKNKNKDE